MVMLKLYHKSDKKDSLLCKREKNFSAILQYGGRTSCGKLDGLKKIPYNRKKRRKENEI